MGKAVLAKSRILFGISSVLAGSVSAQVTTEDGLIAAITGGAEGDTVIIGPGTFELSESLRPRRGMKIRGAGIGKTILRNKSTWAPGNAGLDRDEGAQIAAIDCTKYLFNLGRDTGLDISLSDMTLTGPQLHGGICGIAIQRLELMRLEFKNFLWAGVRTFIMDDSKIHDNVFFDAANKANVTTGSSGGALFLTYFKRAEIWNNRFSRSMGNDGYGIKGREGRSVHIHHNTIDVFFSVELPFEFDYGVEIDHNYLGGAISIPKFEGAPLPPDGGFSFHAHHNYFNTSYSFEFQRNAVEIDHNLFDFETTQDYGNLIASFDSSAAVGWTRMHDNLIRNPGRGIYWNEGVYNRFEFYNNHVRGETTVTPRTEGLFDFRPARNGATTDFSTIKIRDNIIELSGTMRPLMRNSESYRAVIENNTLVGISDVSSFGNPDAGRARGPLLPLCFRLGADEEWTIDGWSLFRTPRPTPSSACGRAVDPGDAGTLDGGVRGDGGGPVPDSGSTDGDGGGVSLDAGSPIRDAGETADAGTPSRATGGCACGSPSQGVSSNVVLFFATFWGMVLSRSGRQKRRSGRSTTTPS